ncbi:MAG: hypothetical protein AB1458_07380 [Bacteroidota bacterium]
MQNRVYIGQDGFIYHEYVGDQSYDIIQNDIRQILSLIRQLRSERRPVLVLGDYSRIGYADSSARKAASEALKDADYDKVALFGTNLFHTMAANLIIIASGKGKKVKVFQSKEKAVRWLRR